MSIQRFDCTNGGAKWCDGCYTMTPDPLGDYVRYEDIAALLEWLPMETAPKDGTPILGWRVDAGVMLIQWTAPDYFLSEKEREEVDEFSGAKEDWFYADINGGGRLEDAMVPTRWMPLPPEPAIDVRRAGE